MKTEHRHELKNNDLLTTVVKVESFYEKHAASLQWLIIGVAFIAACGIYYWRTSSAVDASAWNELSQSNTAEDYAQVASEFSSSRAAGWAKLREANTYLSTALPDAFENREKAKTDLKKAEKILTDLAKENGPKELREQALFALARTLEMSSDGDLKPAIAAYEDLVKQIPDTTFKREAEQRIKHLKTDEAKEFYAFFSKQNPKPAAPPKPNDAKAGSKAGLGSGDDPFKPITGLDEGHGKTAPVGAGGVPLLSPPKLPEITLPEDGKGSTKPATDSPKTEPESKSETKTEPADKAAEKTPAKSAEKAEPENKDEKKSDETPAAEKPADKKPE